MRNFSRRGFAPVIGIIALVAVIGFSMAALSLTGCSSDTTTYTPGVGGGIGGGGGAGVWLLTHTKGYTVTDGVVGNVSSEYDTTWTSYIDDKHYTQEFSTTTPYNTNNDTTMYTQTQVGSSKTDYKYSRDGNTSSNTYSTTTDYTITLTYKDSQYSSSNTTTRYTANSTSTSTTVTDGNTSNSTGHATSSNTTTTTYPNNSTNNSTTSSNSDTTTTSTTTIDIDSGLTKSVTQQQTGTSSTTSNNGSTTQTPNNTNYQYSNTIELLSTEGSAKTYKSYISSYTSNGTSIDVSTQGYSVYKIQDGNTLEVKSYTAAGVLQQVITYSVTDNATIKSKLPEYTITSQTTYNSDGSTTTSYTSLEVVSDSDTELRFLVKSYSGGKLYGQTEYTYSRR